MSKIQLHLKMAIATAQILILKDNSRGFVTFSAIGKSVFGLYTRTKDTGYAHWASFSTSYGQS